jgi:S-adenosyl-L-methionine hydrolase (adenosine-forming)
MGTAMNKVASIPYAPPKTAGPTITGEILHIDHYGNIITNIPANFTPQLKQGVLVRVTINNQTFSAPLVKTYGEVEKGRNVLIPNSQGLIELAVNYGSAARVLKAQVGAPISLKP